MNTYNVNDASTTNLDAYKDFLMQNPGVGSLKIQASAASGAIPISNVQIIVSKVIGGNNFIFFEGVTNESGLIERITLPAPLIDPNNLDVPKSTSYEVSARYNLGNFNLVYKVNMYDGVYVVQNISITPNNSLIEGDMFGS